MDRWCVAFGHQIAASLNGTASDPDVELRDEASGVVRHTVTNKEGFFAITAIHSRSYTVKLRRHTLPSGNYELHLYFAEPEFGPEVGRGENEHSSCI